MANYSKTARLMAGVPSVNHAFYHQIRFSVGDPAALVSLERPDGTGHSIFILRDIEMVRARQHARADRVCCPADFTPEDGLSGDRETATAQAVAECLVRHGIERVIADRTLPLIFAHHLQLRGIQVECDPNAGVDIRRAKDAKEIEWLRSAQRTTEGAIELACGMVARSSAGAGGALQLDGSPLTSERIRFEVDVWLLKRGFAGVPCIVAGGPSAADCHHVGAGPLFTGQPVIIDIFPRDRQTGYHGDCTRTVVHGEIPAAIQKMHQAVIDAKQHATSVCRAGVTGEDVHAAAAERIVAHGFAMGLPHDDSPVDYCAMVHGTGHGIGLDVHEPPLLDKGGPLLVVGDALTIEPGLYSRQLGGIRVEDMVIVADQGCENLNQLHEGLDWK